MTNDKTMSTAATHDSGPPQPPKRVSVMTVAVFATVVLLWLAFGAALVLRQESLGTAWAAFRTAPLPLKAVEGIVLLPWVAGLAIWHARWSLRLRVLLIAGIGWATVYAFFPRRNR